MWTLTVRASLKQTSSSPSVSVVLLWQKNPSGLFLLVLLFFRFLLRLHSGRSGARRWCQFFRWRARHQLHRLQSCCQNSRSIYDYDYRESELTKHELGWLLVHKPPVQPGGRNLMKPPSFFTVHLLTRPIQRAANFRTHCCFLRRGYLCWRSEWFHLLNPI